MQNSPAAERRNHSRAQTRRAILDATEAVLLDEGLEGFSVRKLVERCGYSAPTLYHHFRDKEGLIDALLEERLELLIEELERVPLVEDPVENLRALTRAFANFGLCHPTHYQLLMQVRDEDDRMIEAAERARHLMETPTDQIAARNWIEIGDAEALSQAIWTMVHGIVSMRALRPDVEWKEELLDQAIEGLIRGWLTPKDRRLIASQLPQE
ncbi:MAG: TetR/AcrR family transcriptional regulator [bacterium]|nr:TetR/AcrR family transcriptional regulator [bacterium]MCP5042918.1 TetR/AcrR family transcriptional regulator [bacterium]